MTPRALPVSTAPTAAPPCPTPIGLDADTPTPLASLGMMQVTLRRGGADRRLLLRAASKKFEVRVEFGR